MARLSLVFPHTAAVDRDRRRELTAHFAACGWSGVRRLAPLTDGLLDVSGARALSNALSGQGVVFEAFGRYLAWRADLFDLEVCAALTTTPQAIPPVPWAVVEELISADLGEPWRQRFAALGETPRRGLGLWLVFPGELVSGETVEVWVKSPGLVAEMERDLPLLPLLASGFPRERSASSGFDLAELFADFEASLRRQLDGLRWAEDWAALAAPATEPPPPALSALAPVAELSGPGVVTFRRPPASPGTDPRRPSEDSPARALERARRLALGWCELALERGRVLWSADWTEAGDGTLWVASGQLVAVDSAPAGDLFEYATATAAHDPERAAALLLRLAVARPGADPAELAKRVRQLVPTGGASLSTAHEGLAAHWLAHGRLLRRCGFAPQPALANFYRGAFWLGLELAELTSEARGVAERGRHDLLAEAVEDLSWRRGWASFGRWGKPREVAQTLESYAAALAVLPQRLERVLEQVGDSSRPASVGPSQVAQRTTVALALGLLMLAVVLVAGKLQLVLPERSGLIEKIAALVFLGLGALWLRGLGLGRSSG